MGDYQTHALLLFVAFVVLRAQDMTPQMRRFMSHVILAAQVCLFAWVVISNG